MATNVDLSINRGETKQLTFLTKNTYSTDNIDFKISCDNNPITNGGFEVVTSLPTTDLFEGRMVTYSNSIYFYDGSHWTKITEYNELSLVASTGNYNDLNGLPEHLNFYNIADADKSGSVEESIHHCGLHPGVIAKLNNKTFYPTIDISDEGTISWDFSTLSTTDKLSLLIIGSSLDKGTDAYDTLQSQINHNTLEINNLKSGLPSVPSGPLIVEIEEELYSYGIEKDFRINLSSCTRVGNPALHRTLPVQSGMRGCLLDDDGNIVEYLPQNDWTTATRDGSRGQVMVLIPGHYRKFYTKDEGNIIGVRISLNNIEGYHYVPDMFIGAYEASLDRANQKLASVVNTTDNFRGGDNQSDWDNTYKSLLGLPVTNIPCDSLQEFARNRGSANWNMYMYECHKTLLWLYVIEYADFNCQLEYTSELTENGYKQGGLGSGLTQISGGDWKKYNDMYPIIPCGYTDNFGNNTGMKTIEVNIPDIETPIIQEISRYRGIENIFGHLWKHMIGLNLKISADIDKGGDGTSKVYSCSNPLKFNNNDLTYYKYIGDTVRASNYIKTIIFGDDGCYIASSIGEDSSTVTIGDSATAYLPNSGEIIRTTFVGGLAYSYTNAGIFCSFLCTNPTTKYIYGTSRLCYIDCNNI